MKHNLRIRGVEMKRDWILSFLYAKGETSEFGEPILSTIRLMKNLFILHQKSPNLPDIYNGFVKYSYGACDFEVYDGVKELKNEGLIAVEKTGANYDRYRLTSRGFKRAEKIFLELPVPTRKLLNEIKLETSKRKTLTSLLRYVYKLYPEWAEKSILKNNILKKVN